MFFSVRYLDQACLRVNNIWYLGAIWTSVKMNHSGIWFRSWSQLFDWAVWAWSRHDPKHWTGFCLSLSGLGMIVTWSKPLDWHIFELSVAAYLTVHVLKCSDSSYANSNFTTPSMYHVWMVSLPVENNSLKHLQSGVNKIVCSAHLGLYNQTSQG
jgi:hypothetical protein